MKSARASGPRSGHLTAGPEGPTEEMGAVPLGLHSEEPCGVAAPAVAAEGASARHPVGPEMGACPGRALEAHPPSPESPR